MDEQHALALTPIALVCNEDADLQALQGALAGRVNVVYASAVADFDSVKLAASGANAALVNLDGGDWLDTLGKQLDAAGVHAVFNDSDVSAKLEGWDRARWLRHLVAKLRGDRDVDPPRPDGVQPLVAPPAASAQPLSADEIASRTATFPATAAAASDVPVADVADIDTEALSAAIDSRLAEEAAKHDDVHELDWSAATAAQPTAAMPAASVTAAAAFKQAEVPPVAARVEPTSIDVSQFAEPSAWALVDSPIEVASQARPQAPVADADATETVHLSLEPLQPILPDYKPSPSIERWLDAGKAKKIGKPEGDKP